MKKMLEWISYIYIQKKVVEFLGFKVHEVYVKIDYYSFTYNTGEGKILKMSMSFYSKEN